MYYWIKDKTVEYKSHSLVVADSQSQAEQIFKLQMIDSNNEIECMPAKLCSVCNKVLPLKKNICDKCCKN